LLLVVTSRRDAPFDPNAVRMAVRGGVTLVEARGKHLVTSELLRFARALLDLCMELGVPMIVNDRPDIALAVGAAGAHVGPHDLPPAAARRVLGDRVMGASVRDGHRLRGAENAGADYIGVGAYRATSTKPEAVVLGPGGIAALIARTSLPVVAIGGIRPEDLPALAQAGAAGVAVSGGILEAPDPEAAARAYRRAWPEG
jgi:thiamine-phosphate pyrophosphorylase